MFSALILNILYETSSGIVSVYLAVSVGDFANSIIYKNYDYAKSNILYLLLSMAIMVLLLPILKLWGNLNMFHQSLKHDCILYERFLDKSPEKLKNIGIGEIQYRLENDAIDLRCHYIQVMTKIIALPITIGYLYNKVRYINLFLIIIAVVIMSFQMILPILFRGVEGKYDLMEREYHTSVRDNEVQITTRPYLIKLIGVGGGLCDNLDKIYRNYFRTSERLINKFKVIIENMLSFLNVMMPCLFILFGLIIVSYGFATIGNVVMMLGFLPIFKECFKGIGYIFTKTKMIENLLERLEVVYEDSEDQRGENLNGFEDLHIHNLSFSYEEGKNVIDALTFQIKRGDKIAIVGKNGSGKTTLIKILLGLENNYKGSVKVNKMELKKYSLNSWRRIFSVAFQNPYIFEGTVEENVKLGGTYVDINEVEKQLKNASIYLMKDKMIGVGNAELSGGEIQRISVARAMMKNSEILILDEPINNLDQDGVNWLVDLIQSTKKTVIFISHEDRLTASADRVIYM